MSGLVLAARAARDRAGFKGPHAAQWLADQGLAPPSPNSWMEAPGDALLVARLGASEFFLEDCVGGTALRRLKAQRLTGVYPVLRQDAAFELSGEGSHDVLAQVCNVNFSAYDLHSRPVIMTLMIGVAVLVVPRGVGASGNGWTQRRYFLWCDPTFGEYLQDELGAVVVECGGSYRRSSS